MSGDRLGPAVALLTPDNHHRSSPFRFESILLNHPSEAACMLQRLLWSNNAADIDSGLPLAKKSHLLMTKLFHLSVSQMSSKCVFSHPSLLPHT